MRPAIGRLASSALTSHAARDLRRTIFAARRRLSGGNPTVHYFHQTDDPYSHLAAQALGALAARYRVDLKVWLVPPPDDSAAPDRPRLQAYALRDAAVLARKRGLQFPSGAQQPSSETVSAAQALLAAAATNGRFAATATEVGDALWRGATPPSGPTASREEAATALAQGAAARARFGHYLGAMFYFEGEWHWGVDRLHHLEARLGALGLDREPGRPLIAPFLREDLRRTGGADGSTIEYWFSFRSPYSYVALQRVAALAVNYGAQLRLRFILPMVMRGLPVPLSKRLYIMRDCKREADKVGLAFGKTVDPVGVGVERAIAVLNHAIPAGRGAAFAIAAIEGAFARGIELASEPGLAEVAQRAGVGAADVRAALADESWRQTAEENRRALFEAGLWGAPTFRVNGGPAYWGQDRLWALQDDLETIAAAAG